jgi:hypothetical protein
VNANGFLQKVPKSTLMLQSNYCIFTLSMNSQTLEKRKKLFASFSTQLALLQEKGVLNIDVQSEKSYICPICQRQFSEDYLDNSHKNYLTLEDAPPFALGGSKIALTCKECNNAWVQNRRSPGGNIETDR